MSSASTNSIFDALEKPMAIVCLATTVLVVVWKSALGITWLPVLGPAIDSMFMSGDDGSSLAQYPRRNNLENDGWNTIYFIMYGLLGVVAQWSGWQLSSQMKRTANIYKDDKQTTNIIKYYCYAYGLFHLVIGLHHLRWSLDKNYGKLELWRYDLPAIYEMTLLTAVGCIYEAVQILLISTQQQQQSSTKSLAQVRRHKAVLDTVSVTTLFSFVVFVACNALGVETSFEAEQKLWAVTMYGLPIVLAMGWAGM